MTFKSSLAALEFERLNNSQTVESWRVSAIHVYQRNKSISGPADKLFAYVHKYTFAMTALGKAQNTEVFNT